MTTPRRVPARGDAWWLTLDPALGHEQRGRRPVVVLSPAAYNQRTGMMLCCPVTNQQKGYPFEVALPEGIGIQGVALTDQMKSVDWNQRSAEFIAGLPAELVRALLERARVMLADE